MNENRGGDVGSKVLLVGPLNVILSVAPLLTRSELAIQAVRTGQQALEALAGGEFAAVVIRAPIVDLSLADLLASLPRRASRRFRGVVVLHAAESPPLEPESGLRVIEVPLDSPSAVLDAISSILGVEPRHAARLEVELAIALGSGKARLPCVTRNVSRTGLLVETSSPLQLGTQSAFELRLPAGDRLTGSVEVVRHRGTEKRRTRFVGLRFLGMDGEGESRWIRFIERLGGTR